MTGTAVTGAAVIGEAHAQAVTLLAGLALLTAVLLAWRGPAASPRALLSLQGLALAGLVALVALADGDRVLWLVALLVAGLKGVLLPALVAGRGPGSGRAGTAPGAPVPVGLPRAGGSRVPLLLAVAVLVVVGYLAARPLVALVPGVTGRAVPVGLALVLIGFALLATGTRSRAQLVGFLVLDNGIAATAFLATGGVPLVMELGVSLDVLLVVLVLRVLGRRIDRAFTGRADGATGVDLDRLRELHD